MAASSHRLATAIAARLSQVVPNQYRLEADGATVFVFRAATLIGNSPAADIVDEDDGRTLAEKAESAVYAVLGAVQDIISEDLRTPWPSVDGREMALPFAGSNDREVRLRYGDEDNPSILLASIAFDELSSAG